MLALYQVLILLGLENETHRQLQRQSDFDFGCLYWVWFDSWWDYGVDGVKIEKKIDRVNFIEFPENKPKHLDTGYLVQIKGLGAHFVQAHFDSVNWWDNDMNKITGKVGRFSDVAIFEFINW